MSGVLNKHESKYFNTSLVMNEALLKLLSSYDYEYITISKLTKKAGVNRSTFYLHYENMDDLLKETLERQQKDFFESFSEARKPDLANDKKEDLNFVSKEFLVPYLTYIKKNKAIFSLAKKKPELFGVSKMSASLLEPLIDPILTKYNVPEKERKYLVAFYLHALQAAVLAWVDAGCQDEIDYVADLLIDYFLGKH